MPWPPRATGPVPAARPHPRLCTRQFCESFRAFFQVGSSCWPLLKAELELGTQAGCPAPLLRGWFYARMSVPTYTVGQLVFVRNAYAARTTNVVVRSPVWLRP